MPKILMLRGLQASGKSTFAKLLVDQGWARTNKDDIRALVNNGKWSRENEKQVLHVRDSLIRQYILAGYNVVVDDTNFGIHEAKLKLLAENLGVGFEIKEFDTPIEECLRRDALRANPVGARVIWDTYNKYLYNPLQFATYDPEEKERAIICDIDGTLAHMNGRSPYDYTKVSTDICDVVIKDIVNTYRNKGFKVLIVSGRDDGCVNETATWLVDNGINFDYIFMRNTGDKREDSIIKEAIYKSEIEPKYKVFFVLDDRERVVEKWRSLGLKCLQVAFGKF